MAKSIIASPVFFDSFKVDRLLLQMKPHLELVDFQGMLNPQSWDVQIDLRVPTFFTKRKQYLGGFRMMLMLYPEDMSAEQRNEENFLISMDCSIIGLFRVESERMSTEAEHKFIKATIPAILMPYLRAAISSTFATSGFGTVKVPLINMAEMADKSFGEVAVLVAD